MASPNENLNFSDLIDQVLRRPEFRNNVQSVVRQAVQEVTTNPGRGTELSQNCRLVDPPSTNLTMTSGRSNTTNMQEELRRLFPSIRPRVGASCSEVTRSLTKPSKTRKRKSNEANLEFSRDIILIKNPKKTKTLKGVKKVAAFQFGFGLNAVKFQKNRSLADILKFLHELFGTKLPQSVEVEILIPMSGILVPPSLTQGHVLNGQLLCKVSMQKTVYIRPLTALSGDSLDSDDEDSETALCTLDDTTSFEPLHLSHNINNSAETMESVQDSDDSVELVSYLDIGSNSAADNQFEIDVTAAIENSLHDTEHSPEERTLQDILRQQQSKLRETPITLFNVNRADVFNCCLWPLKRPTFDPVNKVSVMFTDENLSEGAIDDGGPSREMWSLVLSHLKTSNPFEGPETARNLSLNNEAIKKDMYYEADRIIAMSLVHGGPAPHFFSETLFICLTEGPNNAQPKIEEISDFDVLKEIRMIQELTNLEQLNETIAASSFLALAGCSTHAADLAKKDTVVKDATKFYVVHRTRPALDQFIKGLSTLDVYSLMKLHPIAFKDVMCFKADALDASKLNSLFQIAFSEVHSNKWRLETVLVGFWRDYLIDCQEHLAEARLGDVLAFATGADRVPPLGFAKTPSVTFQHGEQCPYPKGNTCALQIQLPVNHNDYEKFKCSMDFGILNGMVFGFE